MPDIYNKEYRKNRLRLFRRNLFYGTRYKSIVIAKKRYKTNTHDICFHFSILPFLLFDKEEIRFLSFSFRPCQNYKTKNILKNGNVKTFPISKFINEKLYCSFGYLRKIDNLGSFNQPFSKNRFLQILFYR